MSTDFVAALDTFRVAMDDYNAARVMNGQTLMNGIAAGERTDGSLELQMRYLVDETVANAGFNTAMYMMLSATLREVADLRAETVKPKAKKAGRGKKKKN